MKIATGETLVVGTPFPHIGGQYWIFVRLETACGVVGYGEIYGVPFHPKVVPALVEDVLASHVIGTSPFDIEALWRRVYSRGYTQRPDSTLVAILSGIEIALWDIAGKALDQPVHRLLGGCVHERLRSYTYIYPDVDGDDAFYHDPDRSAQEAARYVAMGFTALKFDPFGPYSAFDPRQPDLKSIERSALFARKLREAVGDRADLLFGTHGQMTPAGAIRLARRLEEFDPLWFEEPTPPEMPEAMAQVARGTTIPIATGERLSTKYEFARVLSTQAAAILQPAIGRVGGLLEARKIAAMAEAHYAQVAPHLYCGPIEGAANIQFAATLPNFLVLEGIRDWTGFYAEILERPVSWAEGYVNVSTEPGLGVVLNEKVARANPYEGDRLHLEMTHNPAPIER